MMQSEIFTGYFPYGLEETAKRIRAAKVKTSMPRMWPMPWTPQKSTPISAPMTR